MITCMVYDSKREELKKFSEVLRREAAYLTPDEWKMEFYEKVEMLCIALKEQRSVDIICIDITLDGMIKRLEKVRRYYKDTKLLLIADTSLSPMMYLRPSIHPDALLLRPSSEIKMQEVLRELLRAYMDQIYEPGMQGSYTVETRSGKTILPYYQIYYFESREKKIFVRIGRQEYGFYETIEHLLEVLPDTFIRCHRSYIVNRIKVKKVMLSQNLLVLENSEVIPVSRSYRAEVRNL